MFLDVAIVGDRIPPGFLCFTYDDGPGRTAGGGDAPGPRTAELGAYTLVTSCEPCAMCAGAIYWSGIGTVVYGLPESGLRALTGDDPDIPTLSHPCRLVFAAGSRALL